MDKLDNITTEVPPTGFSTQNNEPVNINNIIASILSAFTTEQVEMYKLGEVKRGKRQLSNLDLLREGLYREIEGLSLTKKIDDEKIERVIDSKTRKLLQQQVNNIVSTLEMSVSRVDNRHFILGLLLRLLLED